MDMVTVVAVMDTELLQQCGAAVVLLWCCCGAGTKQVPLSGAWVHGCCGAVVLSFFLFHDCIGFKNRMLGAASSLSTN